MSVKAPPYKSIVTALPVYYGWIVWFAAMIGTIASSPGQSFSISLFMDDFIADFGLDRTTVSSLYGAGTFVASLSMSWIGKRLDLTGNRLMGMAIGLLFGIVLCLSALINGPVFLLIAFIGIRGLGQGALTLVSSTAVANWFRSRRGRMMSYLALVYALFQALYINGLRELLEYLDWRQVFIVLGIAVVALVVPVFGLLMRDTPEEFGMQPDNAGNDPLSDKPDDDSWRLSEAMRAPVLWVYILARMLPSAWGTGLVLHQVSIFAELNHPAQVATETFALMTLFSAASALLAGYLIDRFKPGVVVALQMLALLGACLLASVMQQAWLLILYALSFGFGLGIGYVFDGAVWTNLYGRQYQGEIRGLVFTAIITGSAIGPAVFGLSYDYFGGYRPILLVGALLSIIVLVLAIVTPQPKRKGISTGFQACA